MSDPLAHGLLLSESLHRLAMSDPSRTDHPDPDQDDKTSTRGPSSEQALLPSAGLARSAWTPHVREGYGFRPTSGHSTPLLASTSAKGADSPLPDPNGLGWPGEPHALHDVSQSV